MFISMISTDAILTYDILQYERSQRGVGLIQSVTMEGSVRSLA